MADTSPPPSAPKHAKFPGRRTPAAQAAESDIHERTMKRAAEPLHLARHHLNPHHGDLPGKDET